MVQPPLRTQAGGVGPARTAISARPGAGPTPGGLDAGSRHPCRVSERAPYSTLVKKLQPADLLYIRNDRGRIAHVILWLGVVGVSPNGVPLVLDATGGNHEDANGVKVPIGVHIRPFSANSWFAGDFAHAHRIIHGIANVR